jgi:hypothetical protein
VSLFEKSTNMSKIEQFLFKVGGALVGTRRNIVGKGHTMLFQEFARSHNEGGTHETTCMECLSTVAMVGSEIELYGHESVHVCDPVNLHRMNRDRAPLPLL